MLEGRVWVVVSGYLLRSAETNSTTIRPEAMKKI
jgi:hypothetical protein